MEDVFFLGALRLQVTASAPQAAVRLLLVCPDVLQGSCLATGLGVYCYNNGLPIVVC
jgi:hypothetical protein